MFIGKNEALANTISIPAHIAGDIIVIFAVRDGSTTAPTVPGGWTSAGVKAGFSAASVVGWKRAASSGETSGIWTNATGLIVHVYRGSPASGTPVFVKSSNNNNSANTTVDYSGIVTMEDPGNSWSIRFGFISTNDNSLENPPSGFTNRSNIAGGSINELAGHDTNGPVASVSFGSVSVGGSAGLWITQTVELLMDTGGTEVNAERDAEITGIDEFDYSRESIESLPANDATLAIIYDAGEITDVETDDGTRVEISGSNDYLVHLFKTQNTNNTDSINLSWNGQAVIAPSVATVYLQIYNQDTDSWETVDSDNATGANTDFSLGVTISADLSDYYDADNVVSARVYQQII